MSIQYFSPLSRGITRAKSALFRPFDISRWFAIGLTAFLAGLADIGTPGLTNLNFSRRSHVELEQVLFFPQNAMKWLGDHPGWAIVIGMALALLFIIGVVITWLSSRGKFMFLDNVVHGRSNVVAPWYEYREEGNSFFLWNLAWGIIFSAIAITYIIYCFLSLQQIYQVSGNGRLLILPVVLAVLGLMLLSIISNFIFIFLRDFVIPIMYRDRIPAGKAIQKFLPLLASHLFYFIGYGIFRFLLAIAIGICVLAAGCVTCCLAFLILAIPYINAVALLPVSYSLRSFSIEFLEQFGPEYRIFPAAELPPVPDAQP